MNLKRVGVLAALGFAPLAMGGQAQAQTMFANSASFNAGYGRVSGQENQPVNVEMTDANGNMVAVNSMFQDNSSNSLFAGANTRLGGAADNFSGAGAIGGSGSSIGANLNVVVESSASAMVTQSRHAGYGGSSASTNGKP